MITCLKSMQIKLNITALKKTERKTDRICRKITICKNRRILQETEQDLAGAPQSPLHIPSSLAHSRRNAVCHVNIIHNARSITKRLGTRQHTHDVVACEPESFSLYFLANQWVGIDYLLNYRTRTVVVS